MVSIIAALDKNRAIGNQGELLWRIPEDLKRFKALTMRHPIIMGRKTFESIGRPLPGRTNLVVSRSGLSLEDALAQARASEGGEEIFIIGGAQVYEQALPYADKLYLTLIDAEAPAADAFFPAYEDLFTKKLSGEAGEFDGITFEFAQFVK